MRTTGFRDDFTGGKPTDGRWDFAFFGSPGSRTYRMEAGGVRLTEAARHYAGACGLLSRASLAEENSSVRAEIGEYGYGAAVALYGGAGGWNRYLQLAVLQGRVEASAPSGLTVNDTLMRGARSGYVLFRREGNFCWPCTLELRREGENYTALYNGTEVGSFRYAGLRGDARALLKSVRDPRPQPEAPESRALFRAAELRGIAPPAAAEGTVADAAGRPVAGAVLHAAGYGYALRAETDAQGRFRLEGLPAGKSTLIAAAEGYRFAAREISAPRGGLAGCRFALERETPLNIPRREYNRPDFDRSRRWLNLNGTWEFEFDPENAGEREGWHRPGGRPFGMRLKVPFSWSSLEAHGEGFLADNDSGLEASPFYCNYEVTGETGWYRRKFTVPDSFAGENTILKIGASNAVTTVWCDGRFAGMSSDNYGELEFDLGPLRPGSAHTLAVRVRFPYDLRSICLGKQHWWFTQCPGIWQTVWIEPRGGRYLSGVECGGRVGFVSGKPAAETSLRVRASGRLCRTLWAGRGDAAASGAEFPLTADAGGFRLVDFCYTAPGGDCACALALGGRQIAGSADFPGTLGPDVEGHVRLLLRLRAGENRLTLRALRGGPGGVRVRTIECSDVLRPMRAAVTIRKPDGGLLARRELSLEPEEGAEALSGEDRVPVPDPELWDVGRPALYRVEVRLLGDGPEPEDRVESYFGLRRIESRWAPGHGPRDGVPPEEQYQYLYLNGRPFYLRGVLDQGYNPWGIHTYRAYEDPEKGSVRFDVRKAAEYGYNTLRMHIKENEPLWYYACDAAGVAVWTEHPGNVHAVPENARWRAAYRRELENMVRRNRCHPSVLIYSTINESWGVQGKECSSPWDVPERQAFQREMALLCRKLDPSRLVCDNSGFGKTQAGQIDDFHSYPPSYDAAVREWESLSEKIHPGSAYNYYNAENGGGATGKERQTGCVAVVSEFLHTDSMEQLVRRFPKFGGYVRMNLASAQGEDYSPLTATRDERELGFVHPDLSPAGYAMVNRADLIAFDSSRHRAAEAGGLFGADLFVSHFGGADLSGCRFAWQFRGIDRFGAATPPLASGGGRLSVPAASVARAGRAEFRVPADAAGGWLFAELLCGEKVVSSNYLCLEITGGEGWSALKGPAVLTARPARPLRGEWDGFRGALEEGQRSLAWGKDSGFYEYRFLPANAAPAGSVVRGRLLFEAAARACIEGVNWTDGDKKSTRLRVSVCGVPAGSVVLPDDPFDERALFTFATFGGEPYRHEKMGRYGYGYRTVLELSGEVLAAIAARKPGEGVPVRFEAEGGGLTLYGFHTGRFGFDPMLVLENEERP